MISVHTEDAPPPSLLVEEDGEGDEPGLIVFVPVAVHWWDGEPPCFVVQYECACTRWGLLKTVGYNHDVLEALYGSSARGLHLHGRVAPLPYPGGDLRRTYERLRDVVTHYRPGHCGEALCLEPEPIGAAMSVGKALKLFRKRVFEENEVIANIYRWATRKVSLGLLLRWQRYALPVGWAVARLLTSGGSSVTNWIRVIVRMPQMLAVYVTIIVRMTTRGIYNTLKPLKTVWRLFKRVVPAMRRVLGTPLAKVFKEEHRNVMENVINVYEKLMEMLASGKLKTTVDIRKFT